MKPRAIMIGNIQTCRLILQKFFSVENRCECGPCKVLKVLLIKDPRFGMPPLLATWFQHVL